MYFICKGHLTKSKLAQDNIPATFNKKCNTFLREIELRLLEGSILCDDVYNKGHMMHSSIQLLFS